MPYRKALVVAINDYGGPPNDLPSCINDGDAFSRLLQASYNCREVHSLYDAKATVGSVERELDWLVKDAKSDDRLVFYFSGHGYTKLVNDVMEEFLVLRDDAGKPALWQDNNLVAKTQSLPPGTLSVILDSCFSGGLFKMVFDPAGSMNEVEVAQVKVFQPPPEEQSKAFEPLMAKPEQRKPVRVAGYRRFGCAPVTSSRAISKAFAVEAGPLGSARAAAPKPLSDPTEVPQPELQGLLVSACLETETAAASTSRTDGMSAFTHSMLRSLTSLGNRRSSSEVFNATAASLKSLGFRQTPLILERAVPGNLRNRTFLSMEARKAGDEMGEKAVSLEAGGAASEEDVQKLLPLLGAILPAVLSAAPGIIGAVRGRRKEFDLGGEMGATTDVDGEDMQKFLPLLGAILPAVISAAPGIIGAVRGRRKEFDLGGEMGATTGVGEEDMQKFLPLLGAILPAVISAAPGIIGAVRGRRKELVLGEGEVGISEEEMQKFLPVLGAILPAVLSAAPGIISAVRGRRKELDLGGFEPAAGAEVTDEKIFGAVLRVLPQVLRAAPGILQAFGGQKAIGGFEPSAGAEVTDEKIFGAVLRVFPQVLRAAPGILQVLGGQKAISGFEPAAGAEVTDEKIFGAVLRVLPQVLRVAPGILQSFGGQKGIGGLESSDGGEVGDEKIFGAVLRALPQVLRAAPGIIQAFSGQKGLDQPQTAFMGASQDADDKIFGSVLRILPQVLPHVLQAAQAVAGAQRR